MMILLKHINNSNCASHFFIYDTPPVVAPMSNKAEPRSKRIFLPSGLQDVIYRLTKPNHISILDGKLADKITKDSRRSC
jgi:hypothetical protein